MILKRTFEQSPPLVVLEYCFVDYEFVLYAFSVIFHSFTNKSSPNHYCLIPRGNNVTDANFVTYQIIHKTYSLCTKTGVHIIKNIFANDSFNKIKWMIESTILEITKITFLSLYF